MSDRFSTQRVEVRKNQDATTWYDAHILDIDSSKGTVTVGFEVWPEREVPVQLVRRVAPTVPDFDPQVRVTGADCPSGWSLGRVKVIKSSFYFIGFEGVARDLIVEREVLRPVSNQSSLDISKNVTRLNVPIENELVPWASSSDAQGCFAQILEKSGLLVLRFIGSSSESKGPRLGLIGDDKSIHRAKLLLDIHLKHQKEIQQFQGRKEKKLQSLQDRKKKFDGLEMVEFVVAEDLVGLIIGKGGENIQRVQRKHGVEVRVLEPQGGGNDGSGNHARKVRIFGPTVSVVDAARAEMEFISFEYKIDDQKLVGWVLGKKHANLYEISRKAGLHNARFDQGKQTIELCGTKQAIDDARMLLDSHVEYYDVYQEMDKERDNIWKNNDYDRPGQYRAGNKRTTPTTASTPSGSGTSKRNGVNGGNAKENKTSGSAGSSNRDNAFPELTAAGSAGKKSQTPTTSQQQQQKKKQQSQQQHSQQATKPSVAAA